ncbi:hypothetical protein BDW69DRAFT_176285 [Aspergillus filifer]
MTGTAGRTTASYCVSAQFSARQFSKSSEQAGWKSWSPGSSPAPSRRTVYVASSAPPGLTDNMTSLRRKPILAGTRDIRVVGSNCSLDCGADS